MPGTNSGGDDSLAPTEMNDRGSADEPIATPPTPPISEAEQRQRDEVLAKRRLLLEKLELEKLERIPIPEDPEPSPFADEPGKTTLTPPISGADQHEWNRYWDKLLRLMERVWFCFDWPLIPKELSQSPLNEKELLPRGWEWREGASGIVLPVAPLPDPNEPATVIIRYMNYTKETINGRPVRPGTVAEIDFLVAAKLFGIGALEFATIDQLRAYEALMLQVDKNEAATAVDPLSQQLANLPAETPKLIVRANRKGDAIGKRSFSKWEVRPVDKDLALVKLLEKKLLFELATPVDLKADQRIIEQCEWQSKSQMDARRKHRFKNGLPRSIPNTLVVRLLTPGRFPIHLTQGIIYEERAEECETLPCAAGEIWEVEQNFAYQMLRGKSPVGGLATDAECEAYWAKLIGEPPLVEPAKQGQPGAGGKTLKPKKKPAKGGQRLKAIAALSAHHQYDGESCLNFEPIGVGELAKLAHVSVGTVTNLLWDAFDGSDGSSEGFVKYKRACRLKSLLIDKLKSLNGETRPRRHRTNQRVDSWTDDRQSDDE